MTMDARNAQFDTARADFYQCLARAFLPPMEAAHARAILGGDLSSDLADLDEELGYGLAREIAQLQSELDAIGDPQTLLVLYSQLFLAPPVPARINAGMYLDGAMNGGSVMAMEADYRACGVERDQAFHDLPDHVSMQLEFVALLYSAQAQRFSGEAAAEPLPVDPGHFLHRFALQWLGSFCADMARAAATRELPANPYLPLAQLLHEAALRDALAPEQDPKAERKRNAIEQARAKYAARGISAEDMDVIKRKLQERGLATDHLSVPVDERDGAMGLAKKSLPTARR